MSILLQCILTSSAKQKTFGGRTSRVDLLVMSQRDWVEVGDRVIRIINGVGGEFNLTMFTLASFDMYKGNAMPNRDNCVTGLVARNPPTLFWHEISRA